MPREAACLPVELFKQPSLRLDGADRQLCIMSLLKRFAVEDMGNDQYGVKRKWHKISGLLILLSAFSGKVFA